MAENLANREAFKRNQPPIFVVGCHRSGTNLLYDMLLSAGGFAIYRGLLPVYEKLIPHCGRLDQISNRRKAIGVFLQSEAFRRSGLNADQLRIAVMEGCRTGGDFIRIVMEAVAREQGVTRWAVYNPDNILRMPAIKRDIPDARFVHIIRDGRDIALSLSKMGGFSPLPWDRSSRSLPATALYWKWVVERGRRQGTRMGSDYTEVHYEDLLCDPKSTLANLSRSLDHDLDYERIQRTGLGRIRESNSSFRVEEQQTSPLNRWKSKLVPEDVARLEALVGDCLLATGYSLVTPAGERATGVREQWMRFEYSTLLKAKLWLKSRTPAGRLSDMSQLRLEEVEARPESERVR